MVERRRIEEAFIKLLSKSEINNVRGPVEKSLKKYPYVVVEVVAEDAVNPYTVSTVSIEIQIWSEFRKDWSAKHYKTFETVLSVLSVQNGLWTKLRDIGLNVMGVYPTLDNGTIDIMDNAGTPRVKSTVESKVVVF